MENKPSSQTEMQLAKATHSNSMIKLNPMKSFLTLRPLISGLFEKLSPKQLKKTNVASK